MSEKFFNLPVLYSALSNFDQLHFISQFETISHVKIFRSSWSRVNLSLPDLRINWYWSTNFLRVITINLKMAYPNSLVVCHVNVYKGVFRIVMSWVGDWYSFVSFYWIMELFLSLKRLPVFLACLVKQWVRTWVRSPFLNFGWWLERSDYSRVEWSNSVNGSMYLDYG